MNNLGEIMEIRCPVCRGGKKMLLMGNIYGKCTCCKGKGSIDESERPKVVEQPVSEDKFVVDVIDAVALQTAQHDEESLTQEFFKAGCEVAQQMIDSIKKNEEAEKVERINPKKAVFRKKMKS